MTDKNTYIYFALKGGDFNPREFSEIFELDATYAIKKGEKGRYIAKSKYSIWQYGTPKLSNDSDLYDHVLNLTNTLFPKIDEINKLKEKYDLHSVLQFVLEIDFNEEFNTPALGLDEKTIEFLYKTKTVVDVDMYRDDSTKM